MIEFSVETEIDRPVEEVFAYVADPTKLASWQTNTVSVTQEGDGPLAVGTRLHEVHRAGGRDVESVAEVSALEPPHLFALKIVEGPLPIDARLTFEPRGSGTLMTFHGSGQLGGALRLASPLLGRTLKHQFAQHCQTLKRVLEERASAERS